MFFSRSTEPLHLLQVDTIPPKRWGPRPLLGVRERIAFGPGTSSTRRFGPRGSRTQTGRRVRPVRRVRQVEYVPVMQEAASPQVVMLGGDAGSCVGCLKEALGFRVSRFSRPWREEIFMFLSKQEISLRHFLCAFCGICACSVSRERIGKGFLDERGVATVRATDQKHPPDVADCTGREVGGPRHFGWLVRPPPIHAF